MRKRQNESVDQGNFQYLFGGTQLGQVIVGSELDDSSTDADGHGLSSVTGTQFLHNVLDVYFDRLF